MASKVRNFAVIPIIGLLSNDDNYITRAIGVATNSTEEVGRIYLDAIHQHVPLFHPVSYLGDAAEAFANAALAVFPTIRTRLMCFAHVYKVKLIYSGLSVPQQYLQFFFQ